MIPAPNRAPLDEAQGDAAGGREFAFTPADFKRIAAMLRCDTGIALSEVKAPMVYSRLVNRVRDLGLASFEDYCALLGARTGADERRRMAGSLTTNVTRFFREPHHFEHLKTEVAPSLMDKARKGGRVRLWSAGCSSGEEPYSIAMTLLSLMPDAAEFDVKILAVDIDPQMTALGRAGLYSPEAMAAVPRAVRDQWFVPEPDKPGAWRASPQLRSLVTFRELNLVSDWPMHGPFQAIFCRNTVIYFEDSAQRRIWQQMAKVCAPPAVLYLGHSERLSGSDLFKSDGVTTYRRVEPK